jgi:hypothetical protein
MIDADLGSPRPAIPDYPSDQSHTDHAEHDDSRVVHRAWPVAQGSVACLMGL